MAKPHTKRSRTQSKAATDPAKPRPGKKAQLPRPEEGSLGPRDGVPRSFVLHSGALTPAGRVLLSDLRGILSPYTAEKLRQNRTNTLKDFVSAASVFGVTHLLMLTQPAKSRSRRSVPADAGRDSGTGNGSTNGATDMARLNLRIGALPRGPTLTFRINKYALRRDVARATRRPSSPTAPEYATPPLLVLSGFKQPEPAPGDTAARDSLRALSLVATTLQRLFPAVNPAQMRLGAARRVVLVHYNAATRTLDWRHFLVSVRPTGVSKRLRKVVEGQKATHAVPDLGEVHDIADYVLGKVEDESSYETDTDAESDIEGGKTVELFDSYAGRGNRRASKKSGQHTRAVKLTEIGPRLELRLIKVEEGLNGGQVLWHDRIRLTPQEATKQKQVRAQAEATRNQRREEQEANVQRKRRAQWDAKNEARVRQGLDAIPYPEDQVVSSSDEDDDTPQGGGEDEDEFAYEDAFGGQANQEEEELYQLSDHEQGDGPDDSDEDDDDDEDEDEDEDESDLSPVEAGAEESQADSASEPEPEVVDQGLKRKRGGRR